MTGQSGKTPYRCTFCRERLMPLPMEGADYIRALMLVRPFQCPHCFTSVARPFCWIGRLTFLRWLTQRLRISRAAAKPGSLPHRDGDIGGPVTKGVARFGRWVTRCERRIGEVLSAVGRAIWTVVCFVPRLVIGKRKPRSHKRFIRRRR